MPVNLVSWAGNTDVGAIMALGAPVELIATRKKARAADRGMQDDGQTAMLTRGGLVGGRTLDDSP